MPRYLTQPTTDQGNVIGSRLANEIEHRFNGDMRILSKDDQRDSSIAELLAGTGEVVNVKSYGATGDGSTDDSAAIVAAEAATTALTNGGLLVFSEGTYKIDSSVTFSADVTVMMMPGARFSKGTSGALVFNGGFEAGLFQTFSGFSVGDVTKLRKSRPQWWGGVVDDTGVDNATPILAALQAVAPQEGEMIMSSGTYSVATEIKPTITISKLVWRGEGRAILSWNGATDAAKAVFNAAVSTSAPFSQNDISNLRFDANSKAGFAFILGAATPATGNGSQNIFTNCLFDNGTVVGLLIGTNVEPAVLDSATSLNSFIGGSAANSPINVKINAVNAVENTFNQFGFVSNVSGRVNQHLRVMFGGMTRLNGCEFGPLQKFTTGLPHGAAADTYCVYSESPIAMLNTYTEEARLLRVPSVVHSFNDFVVVDGVYVNDSRTDSDLDNMFLINVTSAALTAKNIGGRAGSAGARPMTLASSIAYLENITLGSNGVVTLTTPEKSVVDGIVPGGFESLVHPHNWDFQHWVDSSGSDDTPMYWVPTKGTGGTAVLLRSALNNVFGDFTLHINASVASTDKIIGVTTTVDVGPGVLPYTVVVTGKTDGTDASAAQVRLNNVTKANNTIINSDDTFVITAEVDPSGEATGTQDLAIGLGGNLTGELHIDTIVVVPGFHGSGLATAFISAAHLTPIEYVSTLVWNPANLIDGAGETSPDIAVAGARLSDFALVAAPYDLQGIIATAYVQASDVVKIRIQNETTGTINLASDTWQVRVLARLR